MQNKRNQTFRVVNSEDFLIANSGVMICPYDFIPLYVTKLYLTPDGIRVIIHLFFLIKMRKEVEMTLANLLKEPSTHISVTYLRLIFLGDLGKKCQFLTSQIWLWDACTNPTSIKIMPASWVRPHGIPTGSGGFQEPSCKPSG